MTSPNWVTTWQSILPLSEGVTEPALAAAVFFVVAGFFVLPAVVGLVYAERKIGADLQARVGPSRAGPAGLLQPLADLLKLIQKRKPRLNLRESMWTAVHTMSLYSTIMVLPFGTAALMVDTEQSVFIPFLAVLVWSLATMVLGLSRSEAPAWFGAMRVGVQALMGMLPAWIACLCAGVRSGSFRWSEIALSQGSGPMAWAAFSDPFQLLAMVVFLVSGMAALGVAPLEGGYDHSDLSGGVFSRFSGTQIILFRIGRVYAFFVWALITAVLFLGAWNLPEGIITRLDDLGATRVRLLAESLVLVSKTIVLSAILFWAARANPRAKIDQIADLIWKVLTPGAVIALVGTTFWVGMQRWVSL